MSNIRRTMMAAAKRGGSAVDWESMLRSAIEGEGTGEFIFPSGTTKLRQYGLANTKFSSVIIPDSVRISNDHEYNFLGNCKGLTHVEFGSGLTRIDEAFCKNCTALVSVTIPAQITSISYQAFNGCSSLTEVICMPTTPPTLSSSVFGSTALANIYVPDNSVAAYKAANNWSAYASIIKGISERPT